MRLRGVTLRQLLSHTSGLAQTFASDPEIDEALARIPQPVCDQGRCWNYADGNCLVVGLVLEAATGMPLSAALKKHLLDPLGVAQTRFTGDHGAEPVPHRLRRHRDQQLLQRPARATHDIRVPDSTLNARAARTSNHGLAQDRVAIIRPSSDRYATQHSDRGEPPRIPGR